MSSPSYSYVLQDLPLTGAADEDPWLGYVHGQLIEAIRKRADLPRTWALVDQATPMLATSVQALVAAVRVDWMAMADRLLPLAAPEKVQDSSLLKMAATQSLAWVEWALPHSNPATSDALTYAITPTADLRIAQRLLPLSDPTRLGHLALRKALRLEREDMVALLLPGTDLAAVGAWLSEDLRTTRMARERALAYRQLDRLGGYAPADLQELWLGQHGAQRLPDTAQRLRASQRRAALAERRPEATPTRPRRRS